MLAQLESTSGKRPKAEVAAIRAKIIASMQSLEEQSFESDETPTFDVIMANANAAAAQVGPGDIEEHTALDGSMNSALALLEWKMTKRLAVFNAKATEMTQVLQCSERHGT